MNQPDEFAVMNGNAITLGFASNEFNDARNGRIMKIGEVHRDLRATIDEQSQAFDVTHTAGRMPSGLGDLLGNIDISGGEIHIECYKRIARANNGCTRFGKFGWTVIRLAFGVGLDLGFDAFVLSPADVFKVGAFGTSSRRFI